MTHCQNNAVTFYFSLAIGVKHFYLTLKSSFSFFELITDTASYLPLSCDWLRRTVRTRLFVDHLWPYATSFGTRWSVDRVCPYASKLVVGYQLFVASCESLQQLPIIVQASWESLNQHLRLWVEATIFAPFFSFGFCIYHISLCQVDQILSRNSILTMSIHHRYFSFSLQDLIVIYFPPLW